MTEALHVSFKTGTAVLLKLALPGKFSHQGKRLFWTVTESVSLYQPYLNLQMLM